MSPGPSPEATLRWMEEYGRSLRGPAYRRNVLLCLRRTQQAYESCHPDRSLLDDLDSTRCIAPWLQQAHARALSRETVTLWFSAIRGFTRWLFSQGKTDHDVLIYVTLRDVLAGALPDLRLHRNLQRSIAQFGRRLRAEGRLRPSDVPAAHRWNLHRNQPGWGPWRSPELEEEAWLAWLETLVREVTPDAARRHLSGLERFFDFLAARGEIPANALTPFLRRYRSPRSVVAALSSLAEPAREAARAALAGVERQPAFQSCLAPWLESYVGYLRSRGRRVKDLSRPRLLDRMLLHHGVESGERVTPTLLEAFLEADASGGPGKPAGVTRAGRLSFLRDLQRFLKRRGPAHLLGPIPDRAFKASSFRPHLFTLQELGRILEALRQGGEASSRPFTWRGLEAMVFLLYACGLRLGEALRLRLGEVHLEGRVLLVARTKFYKERWVPLGQGAARRLGQYLSLRDREFPGREDPSEPVFLTSRGGGFHASTVEARFRQVVDGLGIRSRGTRPPRLHDLRHTLAVHRLYQWYSEGADVQNKLPLLSTYLGHTLYTSTEVYLRLTEDLVRQAGRNFEASFERIVGAVSHRAPSP